MPINKVITPMTELSDPPSYKQNNCDILIIHNITNVLSDSMKYGKEGWVSKSITLTI